MTLVDRIKKLAARPHGMCSNDIETHSTTAVGCACIKLLNRGELHRVKLAHKNVRWFADKAKAEALQAKVDSGTRTALQWHRHDAPSHGCAQWPADAEAIRPAHVRVQVLPGFSPRFQEHTFPFIHGGLRAA